MITSQKGRSRAKPQIELIKTLISEGLRRSHLDNSLAQHVDSPFFLTHTPLPCNLFTQNSTPYPVYPLQRLVPGNLMDCWLPNVPTPARLPLHYIGQLPLSGFRRKPCRSNHLPSTPKAETSTPRAHVFCKKDKRKSAYARMRPADTRVIMLRVAGGRSSVNHFSKPVIDEFAKTVFSREPKSSDFSSQQVRAAQQTV